MCHSESLVLKVSRVSAFSQSHDIILDRAITLTCFFPPEWTYTVHKHPPSEEGLVLPGREIPFSYGTLSVSSDSTRQERSVSRTRNGGWYSNAASILEPGLCLWCTTHTTAETPMIATTLRMTRPDSSALDSGREQVTMQRRSRL